MLLFLIYIVIVSFYKVSVMKISIIIPAYNEEKRIKKTLLAYASYFKQKKEIGYDVVCTVVLNGCTDTTKLMVESCMQEYDTIELIDLENTTGKGIAIIKGFEDALIKKSDMIGFVDADMATSPAAYFELIQNIGGYDGIIASRYMPASIVLPARPKWKRWGSRFVYEPIIKILFGLSYYDFQCGAKLFKRHVIQKIITDLLVRNWAIDLELLYLCKKNYFSIKELPTTWHDQKESKMSIWGGLGMMKSLFLLRLRHSFLRKIIKG